MKASFLKAGLLGLGLVLLAASGLRAEPLAKPDGPVILTIAGAIGQTNRKAFDPFEDGFLKYHDKAFKKAAAFDRTMLEQLGMTSATVGAPNWTAAYLFEGPRLRDVLAAVGAEGRDITAFALDGYAVELSAEEIAAEDWILALMKDGSYLGLGGRGPTWLLYPPEGEATTDDEARWPWSVFYIEVK